MQFPKDFLNKKILIFGYGKTGKSAGKLLNKFKINYSIYDDNINKKKNLFDKEFYKKNYDFIILSPGINIYNHRKKNFFQKNKTKIITDLDIFFSFQKKYKYTIGITGTNGKSGFCNLLKYILDKNNIKSKILGNFGIPVLDKRISGNEICIIELSSYQIDYSKNLKLDKACILNVSPDHLERHKTLSNYKKIKLKIFKFLKENGRGYYHQESFPKYKNKNKIKSFSNLNKNFLKNILGKNIKIHKNYNNQIKYKLPHRVEYFFKKNNFKFINDSKSTNFEATKFAIQQNKNIILIIGGLLKKGDSYNFKNLCNNLENIYIFGKKNNVIQKSLNKQKIRFTCFDNLRAVLKDIYKNYYLENKKRKKNFTVLFSPAAASFDQFKNFEDRGNKFKKYTYEFFKNR
jgi:UDP-N-acetylmuramoylalanine--D-glutamate ligase